MESSQQSTSSTRSAAGVLPGLGVRRSGEGVRDIAAEPLAILSAQGEFLPEIRKGNELEAENGKSSACGRSPGGRLPGTALAGKSLPAGGRRLEQILRW